MASQRDIVKLYSCPICLEIYNKPIITACRHRFCQACFKDWTQEGNEHCPVCRQPLGESEPDENILLQIKSVEGACQDCDQKMTLESLRMHVATCPKKNKTIPEFSPVAETKQPIPRDTPNRVTFPCPYCPEKNLNVQGLLNHCNSQHQRAPPQVVCPICAAMPWGDKNMKSSNFLQHLNMRHRFEYDTYVDYNVNDDDMLEAALKASLDD